MRNADEHDLQRPAVVRADEDHETYPANAGRGIRRSPAADVATTRGKRAVVRDVVMNGTANDSTSEKTGGLRCPKCCHRRLHVIYTRNVGGRVVRRRECQRCAFRITTWEHIVSR
jgi:hypothetical protein